jgi:hypothetical protein
MSHLQATLNLTKPGYYHCVDNRTSANHHIRVYDTHVKYLCVSFTTEDGSIQYFVFLFLYFGLSSAANIMTKLCKPVASIASLEIRQSLSRRWWVGDTTTKETSRATPDSFKDIAASRLEFRPIQI